MKNYPMVHFAPFMWVKYLLFKKVKNTEDSFFTFIDFENFLC